MSEALDVIRNEVVSLDQQTGAVLHDRDADFLAKQLEYEEHHRNLVEEHQREAEKQSARLATLAANAHISALAVVQRASSVHADTAWGGESISAALGSRDVAALLAVAAARYTCASVIGGGGGGGRGPSGARVRQRADARRPAFGPPRRVWRQNACPPPKTVTMAAGSSSQQPVRQAQAAASGYDGGSSSCCELSTAELTAKALLEAAALREAAEAEAEASEPNALSPGRGGGGGQAAASPSSLGGGEATIATLTNLIAEAIVNAAKQLHSRGEEKAAAALTAVVSASSTAASPSARLPAAASSSTTSERRWAEQYWRRGLCWRF